MHCVHHFRTGDRVKLKDDCPIDFEAVGPTPGDIGQIVSAKGSVCLGVRFQGGGFPWLIPGKYLRLLGPDWK